MISHRMQLRFRQCDPFGHTTPLPWRLPTHGRRRSRRRHDLGDVGKVHAHRLPHRPAGAHCGGEAGQLGPGPGGEGGVPLELTHLEDVILKMFGAYLINKFLRYTEFPIPSCREVFRKSVREFPWLVGRYCS